MDGHFSIRNLISMNCILCNEQAVAIYYFSKGCYCKSNRDQPLCFHHAMRATPVQGGSKELVKDLTLDGSFTKLLR